MSVVETVGVTSLQSRLKKAKKADGVVTQIVGYLEELSAHPLAKGRKVRGIIVSGRADDVEAGTLASERRFRIEWYCYKVSAREAPDVGCERALEGTSKKLPLLHHD